MSNGDRVGPGSNGRSENFPWMGNAFVQTSLGNLPDIQQPMARVEQQDPERLMGKLLHLGREQGMDHSGTVDPDLFLLGSRHAATHLEGRLQLCRLGLPDSGDSGEFLGSASRKPSESSPLSNQ